MNDWGTTAGGYEATAGVGGPFTGKGFHLGICDDLIKNADDAQSEVVRDSVWEWFTSTFWTRREPGGVLIFIGTPWHRDDPLARLRTWGEPIRELNLPALCDGENDPLGRKVGDPLWPDRFDSEELESMRIAQGPYYWNALYQLRPSQHEKAEWSESYFNESIWFDHPPPHQETLFKVLALDPSLGKTDKSDYSAFVMLTLATDGNVYVDADLARRDITTIVDTGLAICGGFQPQAWAVEVNGFRALEELIITKARGLMPPMAAITQHKDKIARIRLGVGPYLAYGKLRFCRGSQGAAMLVQQLKDFPLGDYVDGPDGLEMGLRTIRELESNAKPINQQHATPQRVYV